MASDTVSDLTSTISTSELEVPTEIARVYDAASLQNHAPSNPPVCNLSSYTGLDWARLKGYRLPIDNFEYEPWVWRYGWRIQHVADERFS